MSQTVIIGKEGTQSFEIKNEYVSRQHAKIVLEDDGRWILEDLNSTNGTFIQNEDGEYVQVKKVEIDEFTRIALGSTTALGYYFYAHHILEDKDDYSTEMRYVLDRYEELMNEQETIKQNNQRQSTIASFMPALVSFLITIVVIMVYPGRTELITLSGAVTTLLVAIATLLQQKNVTKIKNIGKKQSRLIRCPKCNRPLSTIDIANEQCSYCNTH